jgi:hypothetical protein
MVSPGTNASARYGTRWDWPAPECESQRHQSLQDEPCSALIPQAIIGGTFVPFAPSRAGVHCRREASIGDGMSWWDAQRWWEEAGCAERRGVEFSLHII